MTTDAIVIDDHRLFGAGLCGLLEMVPGIETAKYFADPEAALTAPALDNVRVIISDFFIPGHMLTTSLPRLRKKFPTAKIVVVSASISRLDRETSEHAGADAYFEKSLQPELFLERLTALMEGKEVESSTVEPSSKLTPRQEDILIAMARGLNTKQIASDLGVSTETVKTHISRLYSALGVATRQAAVTWARENGYY